MAACLRVINFRSGAAFGLAMSSCAGHVEIAYHGLCVYPGPKHRPKCNDLKQLCMLVQSQCLFSTVPTITSAAAHQREVILTDKVSLHAVHSSGFLIFVECPLSMLAIACNGQR